MSRANKLFLLILGISSAWDGCTTKHNWRCGNTCIARNFECKCGDAIFRKEEQKWCCHNSCIAKGRWSSIGTWVGEKEGDKVIGAQCSGKALNLSEPCNQRCNYYEGDVNRNRDGV